MEDKKRTGEEIKNILEKEVLTYYDLQHLIEYISQAFKRTQDDKGFGIFNGLSDCIKNDVDCAVGFVKAIAPNFIKLEKEIYDKVEESYDKIHERLAMLRGRQREEEQSINKLISELPPINFPDINIPYGWQESLKMAKELANMTEEQRKCWYELMKTFKK